MRKLALGALLLGLVACAGKPSEEAPLSEGSAPSSATSLPEPTGEIPAECQALLDKAQQWGFLPGRSWKPSSPAQALEVARFFGDFHFVPAASAEYFRVYLSNSPPTGEAAAASNERMQKVQICDPLLAQGLLDVLIAYPWATAAKREAQTEIFQFVLNQQSRVMPYAPRLVALEVYRKALGKGLAKGTAGPVKALLGQAEKGLQKLGPELSGDATKDALRLHEELELSERLREGLSRSLPLP